MTSDALLVVEAIFETVWRIFNSWYIPGTNVTPAVLGFGVLFILVVKWMLSKILGLWGGDK